MFDTNRILNPALVPVELGINRYVLFINRKNIPHVWWRVVPILIGLVIDIDIGTLSFRCIRPAFYFIVFS